MLRFASALRRPGCINFRARKKFCTVSTPEMTTGTLSTMKYRRRAVSETASTAQSAESQRQFWSQIGNEMGVKNLQDWYSISSGKLPLRARSFLRAQYKSSFSAALKSAYPTHQWDIWKFLEVPRGYWDSTENRRSFTDAIGKRLGVNKMEDWYRITKLQWVSHGGKKLSRHYAALPKALMDLYPNHSWVPWKFDHWVVPRSYWQKAENRQNALVWLAGELAIGQASDKQAESAQEKWYKLTISQIREHGLYSLLSNYYDSSFASMLREVYPQQEWLDWLFPACPKSFWNGTVSLTPVLGVSRTNLIGTSVLSRKIKQKAIYRVGCRTP
jgi:hypothetical protein